MKLFGRTVNAFTLLKVCGYVSGFGGLVSPDVIEFFGVHSPTAQTHVLHLVGGVVAGATLIANALRTSISTGSTFAVIPKGSMPVVADANGSGNLNVAVLPTVKAVDGGLTVTSASRADTPKP